jgi:hypothetical protein
MRHASCDSDTRLSRARLTGLCITPFFNLPRLVPLVLYAAVICRGRLTLVFRLSLPPWLYYGDVNFGWCEYYGIHGPVESFHIQEMGNRVVHGRDLLATYWTTYFSLIYDLLPNVK